MRRLRICAMLLAGAGLAAGAQAAAPPLPGLATVTIVSPETDLPVPDAGSLVSLLTVDGVPGVVVDVDVTLDIAHPQSDQLDVFLVAPSGRTVTLTTDNGGANDDVFAGVTFDDQASGTPAAPNVRNFTYADRMATGAIQPEEALGALVGETADGPWALVVTDDGGGQTGTLRSWSIAISTVPAVTPSAPLEVAGAGGAIPDNRPAGMVSAVQVSGAGRYLYDVDVTLDITHPNAADLDVFLTAPSGRRIDLVTDVGGGNDGLWVGTTFDDQAGLPVSDTPLPPDGTAFGAVAGEGALSAFLGEDPNGTWTLTVVDDAGGNAGTLDAWRLRLVTTSVCGDGMLDPGEQCDDGNSVSGDGCDATCTPTVRPSESSCDNCMDDDGNGLTDAADPACQAGTLALRRGTITRGGRARVDLKAALDVPATPTGPVGLLLADADGTVLCADLGQLARRGRALVAKGRAAGGNVTVRLAPRTGRLTLAARNLDLTTLGNPTVTLGLRLGPVHFVGTTVFRQHGRRWTFR
jgi:cysteine-rich repeat protein